MRDEQLPIELRLAAASRAAPYFHARVSSGVPKASFEMSEYELRVLLDREREHRLRLNPGQHNFRTVDGVDR
jgi:hypothetical protein